MDRISRLQLPNVDLRLLQVFCVLMSTRSVTMTANELQVTQPAVSQSLAKLREIFGDSLFARTPRGMEPTALAKDMLEPITGILALWSEHLASERAFDPATSQREFTICGSDIGEFVLLTKLLQSTRLGAPQLRFRALPLLPHALAQQLEEGAVDLVFGGYPALYAGIHEQTLYFEHYVCMARKDHPLFLGPVTLETFCAREHVLVSARSLGHAHGETERLLMQVLPDAAVRVTTQSFLLATMLAQHSDLILSAPSAVTLAAQKTGLLRVFDPPIELPGFAVKQYWHERMHKDAGHRWLRATIADLFQSGAVAPAR